MLRELIEKRHELAKLLRYNSYAAMAMDGLMIGSPGTLRHFCRR